MDPKQNGTFSLGLRSLQLLAQSLLDDCGGQQSVALLDALSDLSSAEQSRAITLFISVLQRLKTSGQRLEDADDVFLKNFEEALYKDLLSSMREAANGDGELLPQGKPAASAPARLRLVEGRQADAAVRPTSTTLDFGEARRKRLGRAVRVN